ncbi:hypothetical protein HanHA300_Chr13g0475461 [Helianthus annuus]|nr:hypothetical protein HanHA300_Chr13g0475461 [Helianthus annuus]KAJ0497078.1 hypothetical protein HanHA89_Chr13g0507381 [Helianthus annuus]KAJ0663108.1 hypothetical protein HanLR1_Chr13g0477571 [Helianthus annuus]KAJ0670602.1 hypothetical protein HanOQP8_Chr13g0476361 [Helianthus annuus]
MIMGGPLFINQSNLIIQRISCYLNLGHELLYNHKFVGVPHGKLSSVKGESKWVFGVPYFEEKRTFEGVKVLLRSVWLSILRAKVLF